MGGHAGSRRPGQHFRSFWRQRFCHPSRQEQMGVLWRLILVQRLLLPAFWLPELLAHAERAAPHFQTQFGDKHVVPQNVENVVLDVLSLHDYPSLPPAVRNPEQHNCTHRRLRLPGSMANLQTVGLGGPCTQGVLTLQFSFSSVVKQSVVHSKRIKH